MVYYISLYQNNYLCQGRQLGQKFKVTIRTIYKPKKSINKKEQTKNDTKTNESPKNSSQLNKNLSKQPPQQPAIKVTQKSQ